MVLITMTIFMNLIKKHTIPILLFTATITIYSLTLSPTVNFGDSGEFISVAKTLGIAHPPGYPLWSLIARLFSTLPLKLSVAARINLLSALFSSFSVLIVYFILKKIILINPKAEPYDEKNEIICFSAAMFMGFTLVFWRYAVITEVYSLNVLFTTIVIYTFLLFYENKDEKFGLFFFYLSGLGLTIHPTYILILPIILAFVVIIAYKNRMSMRLVLPALFLFILGASPYLYLFIRSFAKPDLDWGGLSEIDAFIGHILRNRYPSADLIRPFDLFYYQLLLNLKELIYQFLFLPVIIFIYGIWHLYKKAKLLAIFFGATPLLYLLGITLFNNAPISMWINYEMRAFLLPVYIFITIGFGYGMQVINSKIRLNTKFNTNPFWLIFPLLLILLNYKECDKSKDYIAYNYAKNMLDDLEENGTILTVSDFQSFPILYLNYVENYRPDVSLIQSINIRTSKASLGNDTPIVIKSIENIEFSTERLSDSSAYYIELNRLTNSITPYLKLKNMAYKVNGTTLKPISPQETTRIINFYNDYLATFIDEPYFTSDPINLSAISHLLNQLSFYFDINGRADLSNKILLKAQKMDPYFLPTYYNLAMSYFSLNNQINGEATLQKLTAIDPYFCDAQFKLGLLYEQNGETDKAIRHYEKAQYFAFDKIYILKHLGDLYFDRGDYKNAEKIYKRITKQDFFYAEVNEKLGLIYFKEKRYSRSLYHFKIANKYHTRLVSSMKIGDIRMLYGRYKDAEKNYLEVLNIDENNLQALTKLVIIYNELKEYGKENRILEKAFKVKSSDFKEWIGLACYYSSVQNRLKCYKVLNKAIEIGGNRIKKTLRDEDCLKELWQDERFKILIEPNEPK